MHAKLMKLSYVQYRTTFPNIYSETIPSFNCKPPMPCYANKIYGSWLNKENTPQNRLHNTKV